MCCFPRHATQTKPTVRELIPGEPDPREWEKVNGDRRRRVRSFWKRKGAYYAQLNASGKSQQYKYRLDHAQTVPQAITAMQVLKARQQEGTLLPPAFEKKQYTKQYTEQHGHTLWELIAGYRAHRDQLGG
jgi:hypothetical protein